mmetsp:Transcript_31091/g.85131  ORF Transcript_31091/g.85131 Transcript_31091/m.85131 type:complete len:350 (+) Transcript_31091:665-1714(+)
MWFCFRSIVGCQQWVGRQFHGAVHQECCRDERFRAELLAAAPHPYPAIQTLVRDLLRPPRYEPSVPACPSALAGKSLGHDCQSAAERFCPRDPLLPVGEPRQRALRQLAVFQRPDGDTKARVPNPADGVPPDLGAGHRVLRPAPHRADHLAAHAGREPDDRPRWRDNEQPCLEPDPLGRRHADVLHHVVEAVHHGDDEHLAGHVPRPRLFRVGREDLEENHGQFFRNERPRDTSDHQRPDRAHLRRRRNGARAVRKVLGQRLQVGHARFVDSHPQPDPHELPRPRPRIFRPLVRRRSHHQRRAEWTVRWHADYFPALLEHDEERLQWVEQRARVAPARHVRLPAGARPP